ncbi:MAG: tRNA (guanine(26)-N(2))-dimethyltransferase [Thermoprotei archaeon]
MKLREIAEGRVRLLIPDPEEYKRGEKFDPSWAPVFYNPKMKFNRDISVAFLKAFPVKSAIDGMSATGVRALRYKIEAGVEEVIANDKSPLAVDLIKRNSELNNVKITVTNKDVNALLYEVKAEFVDIDPFGTPSPFLLSALDSSTKYLGVTATDLTALECASRSSARRKYDLTCYGRVSFSKEFGLRALIARIARYAAVLEKAVRPMVSFYKEHYYRVFVEVVRGSGKSNESLRNLGYIYECPKCGYRTKADCSCQPNCPVCGSRMNGGGPVWLDKLGESEAIDKVVRTIEDKGEREFLRLILEEVKYSEPYYNTDFLASIARTSPRKISDLLSCLGDARRTHFDPKGFKTDQDFERVKDCVVRGSARS